ncbi:3-dehydroquinate synthase II family protein [Desulfothermus okinawensis JCM 13304]
MKEIIVKAIPFDKKLVTLSLESGVDGILAEKDKIKEVSALGRIKTFVPEDFEAISLNSKEDELLAEEYLKKGKRVLISHGWEIIPIENLLAVQDGKLGVEVKNLEEAKLASGILEKGVDFLVILPEGRQFIKQIVKDLKLTGDKVDLEVAKITSIKPIGLGHRVCVDTCSILNTGQGMLVGNSSGFTFLIHAETEKNPYVASRPFRVNAGAVHSYVLRPNDKTSYLEELKAGDEVLVVDSEGNTMLSSVGRVKIEIRPLLLISAETSGKKGDVILQNAETIRLVGKDGAPISVVSLKQGDEVLVRVDDAGRHFGMRIKEEIKEK